MLRKNHFLELVKVVLAIKGADEQEVLSCLDCCMAMPDLLIPGRRSLRFFAFDVVDFFMGESDRCRLNYPRAARYVRKWKAVWLPKRGSLRRFPRESPAVVWATDANLVVEEIAGEYALNAVGMTADNLLGNSLIDMFGTSDPAHPCVGAHYRALSGDTSTSIFWLGNSTWKLVTRPRIRGGRLDGVHAVAVLLSAGGTWERAANPFVEDTVRFRPAMMFPAVLWRVDAGMVITSCAGGGFQMAGINDAQLVGSSLRGLLSKEEGWVLDATLESLRGHTVTRQEFFRGHEWFWVFTPIVERDRVVGGCCVATKVAEGAADRKDLARVPAPEDN